MIRRVLEQGYNSVDRERLVRITVFEPGVNKESVKVENQFSKRHAVLLEQEGRFEFK